MQKTAGRPIEAETFRPERVDDDGRPELVTGDAPASGAEPSSTTSTPEPAPHSPEPAPAPHAAAGAAPEPAPTLAEPAPVAAGITTAEILAALGEFGRMPAVRVTREPSPYLVEGGRIDERHGFFADLYAAGARGDGDAHRRAAQFQAQLRDYIAAANSTADSGQIIPPAWGGQWYVEEIARMRPCVGAFSSATITDPRPIPVPAFQDTTPSALVGDHVEGQPDTAGTVNFKQVTVTPKAKSGRAEITRELLDSSPTLADRVVSSALRESYSQITESTMAGVLSAGATAAPVAGGATAATYEGAIRSALGSLPSTRFAPGRVVLPAGGVWGALVSANGTDGRPLFPYLGYGPTNAAGVTSAGYAAGQIAGVETRPAWALAAGETIIGAGPADAMSFESSLLEFRFSEKSGPELVEFNVWGYFGAVVLQALGVLLITGTIAGTEAAPAGGGGNERAGRASGK
jgi:hypothetical protein